MLQPATISGKRRAGKLCITWVTAARAGRMSCAEGEREPKHMGPSCSTARGACRRGAAGWLCWASPYPGVQRAGEAGGAGVGHSLVQHGAAVHGDMVTAHNLPLASRPSSVLSTSIPIPARTTREKPQPTPWLMGLILQGKRLALGMESEAPTSQEKKPAISTCSGFFPFAPAVNALMFELINLAPECLRDDTELRNASAGKFFADDDCFHLPGLPHPLCSLSQARGPYFSLLWGGSPRDAGKQGAQTLTVGSG